MIIYKYFPQKLYKLFNVPSQEGWQQTSVSECMLSVARCNRPVRKYHCPCRAINTQQKRGAVANQLKSGNFLRPLSQFYVLLYLCYIIHSYQLQLDLFRFGFPILFYSIWSYLDSVVGYRAVTLSFRSLSLWLFSL